VIHNLAFHEQTCQIQDFITIFSAPMSNAGLSRKINENSRFRTFHDPWEHWI